LKVTANSSSSTAVHWVTNGHATASSGWFWTTCTVHWTGDGQEMDSIVAP
jgi:hypothetical protein